MALVRVTIEVDDPTRGFEIRIEREAQSVATSSRLRRVIDDAVTAIPTYHWRKRAPIADPSL